MHNWKGILHVKVTDDISKVKLNSVKGRDDYSITFPSSKITDEELKAPAYFRYYRTSPVMELAYGPAGLQFDKLFIEDGDYHKEVYSGAIPYLMTRVVGKVMCPVGVLWHMLNYSED